MRGREKSVREKKWRRDAEIQKCRKDTGNQKKRSQVPFPGRKQPRRKGETPSGQVTPWQPYDSASLWSHRILERLMMTYSKGFERGQVLLVQGPDPCL